MNQKEQLEYEQMRLFDLFSEEEIRQIRSQRKAFNFQIGLAHKEIKDFIEYIKYERRLISMSKERMQKKNIMEENTIAPLIAVHIKQIYSDALAIYPQSRRFWDEYIKFLQQFKFYDEISDAFQHMLTIHDDKPEVWCRAIQWEHHENYQNDRFHDLMKCARIKHPDSLTLYMTLFQVELEKKRKRDVNKAIEYLDECYRKGKSKFPQIEFYIEMLKIVDKLSYARPIQKAILEDVRTEFSENEYLWHTLAQRELHGMTVSDNSKKFVDEIKQEDEDSVSSYSKSQSSDHSVSLRPMRTRIKACAETYKEGIEHIDSEQMWKYYLDCMLDLNEDLSAQSTLRKDSLNEAVYLADEKSIQMSEDQYVKYLEAILKHKAPVAIVNDVLKKATMKHTTSTTLWLQRLRFVMQQKDFTRVKETFHEARNHLEEKRADIWRWYFIFIKSHCTPPGEFERFVVDLANQKGSDFIIIKSYVLELLKNTRGYDKVMDTCELFLRYCPKCPALLKWKTDLQTTNADVDRVIQHQTVPQRTEQNGTHVTNGEHTGNSRNNKNSNGINRKKRVQKKNS